jgi:hypothetical protein
MPCDLAFRWGAAHVVNSLSRRDNVIEIPPHLALPPAHSMARARSSSWINHSSLSRTEALVPRRKGLRG